MLTLGWSSVDLAKRPGFLFKQGDLSPRLLIAAVFFLYFGHVLPGLYELRLGDVGNLSGPLLLFELFGEIRSAHYTWRKSTQLGFKF